MKRGFAVVAVGLAGCSLALGEGEFVAGSGQYALKGAVDDVRLYRRALTPAEVDALTK